MSNFSAIVEKFARHFPAPRERARFDISGEKFILATLPEGSAPPANPSSYAAGIIRRPALVELNQCEGFPLNRTRVPAMTPVHQQQRR